MRRFVLREYDDTAGVAIQPVNGKYGTVFFFQDAFKRRVLALAIGDAEETGGFVDGNEFRVLEKYVGLLHELLIGDYFSLRLLRGAPPGRLLPWPAPDGRLAPGAAP